MTAGKKAGTTRVTKSNTRLSLELLETVRDMHAGGVPARPLKPLTTSCRRLSIVELIRGIQPRRKLR